MKQLVEKTLISEFDTIRKEYIEEDRKLKEHYLDKFQCVLNKIADERKVKRIKIK